MQLSEAVDEALTERYALSEKSVGREPRQPITDTDGLQTRMERIMRKFRPKKGEPSPRRRAAAAVGVPYSTWNHALKGRAVSKSTLAKIGAGFTKLVTAPARALRVKKVGYPDVWSIRAVVVCQPAGSRYVNGRGSTATAKEDVEEIVTGPEYRTFNAEGLDSEAIVGAWLSGGAGPATTALLEEIEASYGDEFGFEGDHVDVAFYKREDD